MTHRDKAEAAEAVRRALVAGQIDRYSAGAQILRIYSDRGGSK